MHSLSYISGILESALLLCTYHIYLKTVPLAWTCQADIQEDAAHCISVYNVAAPTCEPLTHLTYQKKNLLRVFPMVAVFICCPKSNTARSLCRCPIILIGKGLHLPAI